MQYGVTEVFVKQDYYASLRVKLLKKVDNNYFLLKNNGDSLIEVKKIKPIKKIYKAPEGFLPLHMDFELLYIYEDGDYSIPRYKYIMHVGSSRSSKSWSIEEWSIRQCETRPHLRINVWRDTRTSLGDSVWKDFRKIFPLSGRSYKFPQNTIPIYFPNGATIEPHGADLNNAHGVTQDIAWLNEPYDIPEETFHQIDQRCEQMIIDINPKQKHWSDTVAQHPRCIKIHSTFDKNPFCPPEQKMKILSYDPNNPINVKNQTADAYKWSVYGLGLKAEKPNKIYKGWKPILLEEYKSKDYQKFYGLDFGFANPSACVEVMYDGDVSIYVRQLLYKPMRLMGATTLGDNLLHAGVPSGNVTYLWADSSDKEAGSDISQINDLRTFYKINAVPVNKPTYKERFDFISKFHIFYTVESVDFAKEYENYEYEFINGYPTEKPIKKDDHLMNAFEYCMWGMKNYLNIRV